MEASKVLKQAEMIVDVRRSAILLYRELESKVDMTNKDISFTVRSLQLNVHKALKDAVFALEGVKNQIQASKDE